MSILPKSRLVPSPPIPKYKSRYKNFLACPSMYLRIYQRKLNVENVIKLFNRDFTCKKMSRGVKSVFLESLGSSSPARKTKQEAPRKRKREKEGPPKMESVFMISLGDDSSPPRKRFRTGKPCKILPLTL